MVISMVNEENNNALHTNERRSSLPVAQEGESADLKLKLQYFGAAAVPSAVLLEILGAQLPGVGLAVGVGVAAAYFSKELHYTLEPSLRMAGKLLGLMTNDGSRRTTSRLLNRDWWLGQEPVPYAESEEDELDTTEAALERVDTEAEIEPDLFTQPRASDTGGIARLTVEQIIEKTEPNSYTVWIGRSLTMPGNPAIQMKFYKRHLRFIGASQYGKSSMAAAFLWTITRTHDPKHLRIAILDKEDQTGKLFENLPHILRIRVGGQVVTMHARDDKQVLQYLMCVVEIMRRRYKMSKQDMLAQPVLLVYIEEFLSLKNFFKAAMESAKGEAKAQATSDYTSLVYCIEELSQRGLKVRVQLLLCAQVEYADDDFKEALVNVGCGMSFCVRPRAAAAAGFRSTELLNRNYKENKVGQAVIETPDCTDLMLAPDFDLEHRLIALETAETATSQVVPERFPGSSEVVPDEENKPNKGNHLPQDGRQSELDLGKLSALRGMVRNHASQNEIIAAIFPGMRNADAMQEYRKYLAALVEG